MAILQLQQQQLQQRATIKIFCCGVLILTDKKLVKLNGNFWKEQSSGEVGGGGGGGGGSGREKMRKKPIKTSCESLLSVVVKTLSRWKSHARSFCVV